MVNAILCLEKKYPVMDLNLDFLIKTSIVNNGHMLLNKIKHIIQENINRKILK